MKLQEERKWKAIIFPREYLTKERNGLPENIKTAILNLEVQRYNSTGTYIIMKGKIK